MNTHYFVAILKMKRYNVFISLQLFVLYSVIFFNVSMQIHPIIRILIILG